MKIQLLSDLHNEFLRQGRNRPGHLWSGSIPSTDAELIILAGDIDTGIRGVTWAIAESERLAKNIIYVAGNHEFYGYEFTRMKRQISRLCEGTGVFLLDSDLYIQDDVRFIGTTLWTDYKADTSAPREEAMDYIDRLLADHRLIEFCAGDTVGRFKPQHALALHLQQVGWIEACLASPQAGKTVLVTHHGPHPVCQHPAFAVSQMSAAFHSDLSHLIEKFDIDVWVYGHTHANLDTLVADTRIISNQAGYPGEGVSDFNAAFCFDV